MTDFDCSLVELTQNTARLQNDVMFAVRRGARRAGQVVIRAAEFKPHPDVTIVYIAYPPTWRYVDRLAWRADPPTGREPVRRRNRRRPKRRKSA